MASEKLLHLPDALNRAEIIHHPGRIIGRWDMGDHFFQHKPVFGKDHYAIIVLRVSITMKVISDQHTPEAVEEARMKFSSPWPSGESVSICAVVFLPCVPVVIPEQVYQFAKFKLLVPGKDFPRRLPKYLTTKLSLKVIHNLAVGRQSCIQKPCSRANCDTKKSRPEPQGYPPIAGQVESIAEVSSRSVSSDLVVLKPHAEATLRYGLGRLQGRPVEEDVLLQVV